jgi:hypothetical protein
MGVEDREWFQEDRAERLRKAFREATPPQLQEIRRRRRPGTERETLAAAALTLSLVAMLATGGIMWWRVADFRPAAAVAEVPEAAEQAFPASGTVKVHVPNDYRTARWPFIIEGPGGDSLAVVRVRRWEDRQPIMTGYVAGDGRAEMLLEPGRYRVTVAYGRHWRGDEALFGRLSIVEEVQEPIDVAPGRGQTLQLRKKPTGNTPMEGRARAAF